MLTKSRRSPEERKEAERAALGRARNPFASVRNDIEVIAAFVARGIPAADVQPRQNVFTFRAWRALGRYVKRGEHGVKLTVWYPIDQADRDKTTGEKIGTKTTRLRCVAAVVFHVSQTAPID